MLKKLMGAVLSVSLAAAIVTTPALAGKREKAEELVASAAETANYFSTDPAFDVLWDNADDAKAMVIIPRAYRGAFIWGASNGPAVMVARNEDGSWSQPTFFRVSSVSFGLQAGGEASELVLLVMTKRGMEQLLSTNVKLGADVSIAAGPLGAGAKAQTTDILAFARARGLYGGVSLEGAVLKVRDSLNEAYYNANVTPADIIYRESAYNPRSAVLQNAAWTLANKDAPATMLAPLEALPAAQTEQSQLQPIEGAPLGSPQPASEYEDDAAWNAPIGEPN